MTKLMLGAGGTGAKIDLPDDAVTQGFAILARRRSGKSSLAGVIEETLSSRGDPWVFVMSPLSAIFLLIAALMLSFILLPNIRKSREKTFQEA